jgi:NitT/TauT family transport system ATP-binding protein
MAGLMTPSAGVVDMVVSDASKTPTAMVFQDYAIYPWKSVLGNVRFGLDVAGVGRKEGDRRARQWLERLGLAEFARVYPATLSGGMRQRVSIARALIVEPEILLMDEPFAALDAQLRLVLQDELLRLWEADRRTVLFVTHSLDEALFLGDRVLVMSSAPGQIIADIRIPFERPRTTHLRGDAAFAALQDEIWQSLRVEVDRSLDTHAGAGQ